MWFNIILMFQRKLCGNDNRGEAIHMYFCSTPYSFLTGERERINLNSVFVNFIQVKVRCVSRNLEQLIEELPVFLIRLEEIMMAFDDRFQWKDFKFCLQLAISQVVRSKLPNTVCSFFSNLTN